MRFQCPSCCIIVYKDKNNQLVIKLISNHAMVYRMDLNLFLFLVNIKELGTAPAGSHRVAAWATYWYNVTTLQHLVGLLVGPPPSGMQAHRRALRAGQQAR